MNASLRLCISRDGLLSGLLASNDVTRLTELATAARQVASCGGVVELWTTGMVNAVSPPPPSVEQCFTTSTDVAAWLNDINTQRQAKGQVAI